MPNRMSFIDIEQCLPAAVVDSSIVETAVVKQFAAVPVQALHQWSSAD